MKQDVSNEILGAYVDDELDCREKTLISAQINSDPELAARAQELAELKLAIKQAYRPARKSDRAKKTSCPERLRSFNRYCYRAIAASFLLGCGLIVGYYLNFQPTLNSSMSASTTGTMYGIKLQPVSVADNKVLLHITTSELEKLNAIMNQAEYLLDKFKQDNQELQLEVVANSGGIDLLRTDTSPYTQRIKQLRSEYSNLQFIACSNTLRRLQAAGKNTQVVDGTQTQTPAIEQIISRINQGWMYVKI